MSSLTQQGLPPEPRRGGEGPRLRSCPTCGGRFKEGLFCPQDGAQLQTVMDPGPAAPDPLVGRVLADKFRIVSLVGAGGMGTVYKAEHIYIQKSVALKLLRPEITANPEAVTRFQREAMAASTIGHENIVAIDDFGRLPDGQVYLTMELLEGVPLSEVLRGSPLPVAGVLDVAVQTCHGLAAAHGKGIIHRDMKPENIFLADSLSRVKILDFGIAKVIRTDDKANLTRTGTIFGTPNYMAPEQALGRVLDHRADIYSMGIILYEMLTGRLPFDGDSFLAILTKHVTEPPPPPRSLAPERQIPEEIEALVLRAMDKEPEGRFRDMREMVERLQDLRRRLVGEPAMPSYLRLSRLPQPGPGVLSPRGEPAPWNKITATAGELIGAAPRPPRRRGLWIGVLVVTLLAGGATAFLMLRRGAPGPDRLAVTLQSARGDGRSGRDQGAGSAVRPPPPPVEPPAPASRVTVFLDSKPREAAIVCAGRVIGRTPKPLRLEAGERREVTLRLPGFQAQTVRLEAIDGLERIVVLERAPRTKVRAARKKTPVGEHGSDHVTDSHDEP